MATYSTRRTVGDIGCLVISGALVTVQLTADYVLGKLMC
jgi:hypothetical protein